MAEFAVGKQYAGKEGTQRRAQANQLHQEGNRDNDQQRCSDGELANAGPGDDAEKRDHDKASHDDDCGNGKED
jgi:hypothetical protein